MKLPNGKHAYLGDKLEAYSLNSLHREGHHKARVFASALGITLANAELLRAAVLEAASYSDAALAYGDNGFGQVFILKFPLATAASKADILRHGSSFTMKIFPALQPATSLNPHAHRN
jgi:hypothetical protein